MQSSAHTPQCELCRTLLLLSRGAMAGGRRQRSCCMAHTRDPLDASVFPASVLSGPVSRCCRRSAVAVEAALRCLRRRQQPGAQEQPRDEQCDHGCQQLPPRRGGRGVVHHARRSARGALEALRRDVVLALGDGELREGTAALRPVPVLGVGADPHHVPRGDRPRPSAPLGDQPRAQHSHQQLTQRVVVPRRRGARGEGDGGRVLT